MKKRIYCLLLLLLLLLTAGCNKEDKKAAPTPTAAATPTATATPTPTPIPENLAKTNLDKLPAAFEKLLSYQQENTVDTSMGTGYDINLKLSLGSQITNLLGLDGLDNISLNGTIDAKDALAANLTLNLNSSEVINAHVFADAANLVFNLPKYSTSYASIAWEELLESMDVDTELLNSFSSVDAETLLSNEDLSNLLRSHIADLAACFQKVDGIVENAAIGTGDYTMTGDKHTVRADKNELLTVLKSLEKELNNYTEVSFDLESMETSAATAVILEYYAGDNCYAWVLYPDHKTAQPMVFVNTALGFCLYNIDENGTTFVAMNSEKTTETSGIINLFSEEEEDPVGLIDYKYGDNTFYFDAELDTLEITLDGSTANETLSYDLTLVADGISVLLKQKVSKNLTELSCTLASFGVEYGTIELTTKLRDYQEIPLPQNTTDTASWTNTLDQTALVADLLQLMSDYPFLMDLFGSIDAGNSGISGETGGYDIWTGEDPSRNEGSYEVPADYTDNFMNLTGYTVDADGYVDFDALESEVLTAGIPSTGYDTIPLTGDQMQNLITIAEGAFPACEKSTDSYYWVWGSVEYNDVQSYYTTEHSFIDSANWDNNITVTLDAVSGEFISVSIYHTSKDEALRLVNEFFTTIGGSYAITTDMLETYTYADGFSFSGYDGTLYGGNYYNAGFSVFESDWN